MKFVALFANLTIAALLTAVIAPQFGFGVAFLVLFVLGALLARPVPGRLCVATLILPSILQRLMTAYKARLPMLKYFTFDVSPERVKFEQEIIAQMPIIPTALSHTPGSDLRTNAQNVKDLITDIPMKIDQARKVVLKLPTSDAVRLELDPVFDQAISNAGYALATSVVASAISTATASNFSRQMAIETVVPEGMRCRLSRSFPGLT